MREVGLFMGDREIQIQNGAAGNRFILAVLIVLLAFNDIFQYSGYGGMLNWSRLVCIICVVCTGFFVLQHQYIENSFPNIILAITGIWVIISLFLNWENNSQLLNIIPILFVIPVVNMLSNIQWDEKRCGVCSLALMAYAILMIYLFQPGQLFSGWNSNSSIVLVPVLFCAVAMGIFNGKKYIAILSLLSAVYSLSMIWALENRSSSLCVLLFLIVLLFRIYKRGRIVFRIFYSVIIALNIIIPFINASLQKLSIYSQLIQLSDVWFGKNTLLNERDILWDSAIHQFQEHPLLGNGGIRTLYSHNLSTDVLIAVGIMGWIFFIVSCVILMEKAFKPGAKSNLFLYGFAILFLLNTFENVMVCNYVFPIFQYMLIAIPISLNREKEQYDNHIYSNI